MSHYGNILEEQLKKEVARDLFSQFDTTQNIGRVDFCVALPQDALGLNEPESLFWAESKRGTSYDIYDSIIQLILTLGKERPQDRVLPPAFIGAFDAEKIAFFSYSVILDVLQQNDFNWNVAPSNHTTKEFLQLKELLEKSINRELIIYDYDADWEELLKFIQKNFVQRKLGIQKIRINKNNFTHIYLKWLEMVKPTIGIDWDAAKRQGIIDADFYLADILSEHNLPIREKLFVLLKKDFYELDRKIDDTGLFDSKKAVFKDKQKAHIQFWNRYARPPRREYWDYIVNRRDLLVPQDVREREGAFFTPKRWVELSQQYIEKELGEDWQEEYYVWDCCAGTGNLLAGLTNKYNIYASTLAKGDVQVMQQRIESMNNASRDKQHDGANLLESHVFQFDFLNDPFFDEEDKNGNIVAKSKLPGTLQDIIRDSEKRKKLIIYINPPYAEAASATQVTNSGKNKKKVAESKVSKQYKQLLGKASNEIFSHFFIRIHQEIPNCWLAAFSTLKILQASNFQVFRGSFQACLKQLFLVPASTFDNVDGQFPIGFFIWQLGETNLWPIFGDVYKKGIIGKKTFINLDGTRLINKWYAQYYAKNGKSIGIMNTRGNDFQNKNYIRISSTDNHNHTNIITEENLLVSCIYFSVRHCIEATWLNDRDQFLFPENGWSDDNDFKTDCLVYTLFHGQNRISSEYGVNHWIPFTEAEVGAKEKFKSHFMNDFIQGKHSETNQQPAEQELFHNENPSQETPLQFTPQAQNVLNTGLKLWQYYHQQPSANPDASFYDIRLFFQGTEEDKNGKLQMKKESNNQCYNLLIKRLREQQKELASRIEEKVYQYKFLFKSETIDSGREPLTLNFAN